MLDRLAPRFYERFRRMAHRELARGRSGGTLRTTDLVHEAYLKLAAQERLDIDNRAHFFAYAASAMRHIVIDYARRQGRKKRGGGWRRTTIDVDALPSSDTFSEMVELDEALKRLERFDARLCRVVECRFFGGMTVEETSIAMGISPRTVDRAWQKAKAWLYREIHEAQ